MFHNSLSAALNVPEVTLHLRVSAPIYTGDVGSDRLTRRALGGWVFLALVTWQLLFLPAGSVHYWQAWMFWLTFSASTLAITLYFLKHDPSLIERRVRVGPVAEQELTQKMIQTAAGLLFLLELVIPSLDHRFGWSRVPPALSIAGNMLVAVGFFLIFRTFRENSFAGSTIQVDAGQRVISTGPYSRIRHPMYSGALLMLAGTPLALGSYWAMLLVPLAVLIIVWRLLAEERFLSRHLLGYDHYRRTTRYRLIPGIW